MPKRAPADQNNYEVALQIAQARWQAMDPEPQAQRCGAECLVSTDEVRVALTFLYRTYHVTHPKGHIFLVNGNMPPEVWEQILILHYLTSERQVSDPEKLIAFNEIPDGRFYDATFQKRTTQQLLRVFSAQPELLRTAARILGAEFTALGDFSFRLQAFPMINLHFLFWRGDAEFPPEASLLMEKRIQAFLNAEDIAVLGGMAVGALIRIADKIKE